MRILVSSWRNRWIGHIRQTIKHEDIQCRVTTGEHVPCLTLLWNITNNSMTEVRVIRICGDVYIGDSWRIAMFDTNAPSEDWRVGNLYPPQITINRLRLKKPKDGVIDSSSAVQVRLFPPIEFWLIGKTQCSLWNGFCEVSSHWGNVRIPIQKGEIEIDGIEQGVSLYRNMLKDKLVSIMS